MRVPLTLLVLMALQVVAPQAGASEKWTGSKEPVYAQPGAGRALVYVLRDKSIPDPFLKAFEVFLDDVPLGFLRGRKYLHAQKVQDDPQGPKRDPHAALDRVLQLHPDQAEAHYLKARLYGLTDPLTGTMREPDKALQQARLAVDAEPGQMRYREALAIDLLQTGKEAEALELFLKAGRADHPMVVLAEDRKRVPVPAGSTVQPEKARGVVSYYTSIGAFRTLGFPALRVTAHSVPMSLEQVEEFYSKRWPGIRFDRDKKNRKDDRESSSFSTYLEWSGTDLVASETRPEKIKGVPTGVLLMVSDARDFAEGKEEGTGVMPPAGSVMFVINFRNFSDYRP